MVSVSKSSAEKQIKTLLKFLANSGQKGTHKKPADQPHTIKLTNTKGQSLQTCSKLVAELAQSGALSHEASSNTVKLTSAGRARLRRVMHQAEIEQSQRDQGTLEGAQHREMTREQFKDKGQKIEAMVNACESPLGWLRRRKDVTGQAFIDDDEFLAGERLRSDFERSQMRQRISANWEAALASGKRGAAKGGQDIADSAIDARQRLHKARLNLGPDLADLAIDICCHLKGLGDVEKDRHWPRRTARIVLKIALARLAAHYGYKVQPEAANKAKNSKTRIHSWNDGDHKPKIGLLPENSNNYEASSA